MELITAKHGHSVDKEEEEEAEADEHWLQSSSSSSSVQTEATEANSLLMYYKQQMDWIN